MCSLLPRHSRQPSQPRANSSRCVFLAETLNASLNIVIQNNSAYYMNTAPRTGNTIQIETTFDVVKDTASLHIQQPDVYQHSQTSVVSEAVPRAVHVKRAPSDDGLSLNSSTFKVAQDEESRGGEYRLDDLGMKRSSHPSEVAPWDERGL